MELTKGSETSANYNLTPGKYPKEHIQVSVLVFNSAATATDTSLPLSRDNKQYNHHNTSFQNVFTTSLTLNLPMTTIVAQPFNVIKWQLKFNPVA